ncbi:Hypothetical predicted protein [Paramuricea clavata]|uniref:Uncharacterized protein n=1 Tax=Paramuricea clavata TaxID=317549 RepID=A0A7D9DDM8_PARCT|nr:Hypothetical predicted protein [Paramuricea clavata]
MVASRKATKNMDNAISFEQIPTKNLSIILSKDDMENKNVSTGTDQCMSGSTHDLYAQQVYKNVNHLKNVCQSALSTDIETNPGPVFYIDPRKTISAPYSQELPSQLTVFDTDYIFEYSESYSGNVIGDCSIEGDIYGRSHPQGNASEESKSTDAQFLLIYVNNAVQFQYTRFVSSVIKPCNYWDSNTVSAVVYFGTTLYNNTGINTSRDIPQKVEICGNEIHVKLQANIQGVVYDKAKSKLHIESLICHTDENTGFLIWFGDYCISCIFQKTSIKNMSYSILAYDDDDSSPTSIAHYIKNIKDKHTLVDAMFSLATNKVKDETVNYEIQFLSCSSELSNCERKRIMKNHRQSYINDFIEPALKKQKLETKQMKYKTMAQEKKQTILENRRAKYEAMDQLKKEEQLTKNMNYKETMGEEQKQRLLENMRAKYEAKDISKKKELSAMSSSKIMSNRILLDPKQKNNLLNREKEKRMEISNS